MTAERVYDRTMPIANRCFAGLAALLIAAATGLGAIASHALGGLSPAAMHSLETGIDYQFFHGLGLLVLACATRDDSPALRIGMVAVAAGTLLFCGGVYASSLGGPRLIVHAAPIGGVLLILGWLVVAAALFRRRRPSAD